MTHLGQALDTENTQFVRIQHSPDAVLAGWPVAEGQADLELSGL